MSDKNEEGELIGGESRKRKELKIRVGVMTEVRDEMNRWASNPRDLMHHHHPLHVQ